MFQNTSQALLHKYPLAYLQHILLSILQGDDTTKAECTKQLDSLKKAYETMEGIPKEYKDHIIAEILIFKRFTTFNVINPSSECNNEILRLLNGQQSYIMSRENEFTFGSPHLLYVYFRDQGTFFQISQLATERFTTYASFAGGCGTGSEYLIKAEYALETGDWETVELNSFRAVYKARTKEQTNIILCASFTLIRLYLFQGKVSEALDMLKQLDEDISLLNNSIYNTSIDMCKGYVHACLEQREMIPFWLQIGDMTTPNLLYQGLAFNYIIYGKSVMLSKNYVALEVLTESLQEQFSIFSNQLGFLHNHIFKAVASYHLYGTEEGATELEHALAKGQADDILLPFVENAPHIIELLRIVASRDLENEYIQKVVFYSEQFLEVLKNNIPRRITLSQRELEVLYLTAKGLKREEISIRLLLSQGTVKNHLHNIYHKMDVSGKVSAIKIAQMNGLIPTT